MYKFTFSHRTPVYDHAGQFQFDAHRKEAEDLIKRKLVNEHYSRKGRILKLVFRGPDPALLTTGSKPRRGMGMSHTHENYWNPKGAWTIDPIPDRLRANFCVIVIDCAAA